jgi:hypothetical protein
MSLRLSQRRRLERSVPDRLLDEAFARYLGWLAESEAVDSAYAEWTSAPRSDRALPFAAYGAALDREEQAAAVYRSVLERMEQRYGAGVLGARPGAARA